MRLVVASALIITLGAPSLAAAQQAGTPMGDIQDLNRFATRGFMNQWAATRPAALSGLSQQSRRWIKQQVQLQAETPATPDQLDVTIDAMIGRDISILAKSERSEPEAVRGAVLLKILVDTHNAVKREAKRNPQVAPGERPWEERIAEADLYVREVLGKGDETAVAMVRD